MKRFSFALAAAVVFAIFTGPVHAGNSQYGGYYAPSGPQYAQPGPKRQKPGTRRRGQLQELRALRARSECRMYAFGFWRYHPDYQHCRYN